MMLKQMEQRYECKFCKNRFHREQTLTTHICVKKRRFLEINTSGSRLGFRTFQKFYEMTTTSKKLKTIQEFIDSPYYIDFARFGNYLAILKPMYLDQFIEFIIKKGVKLKDWTKDFVYELYIEDIVKNEPAVSATERTITEIMEWCDRNNVAFDKFFSAINANEAAHLIRAGRISPWGALSQSNR